MSLFNFSSKSKDEYSEKNFAMVYSPLYDISLQDHVFPGNKFSKIYELLCLDEKFSKISILEPERAARKELELVHSKEYLDDLLNLKLTERTKYAELPLTDRIIESFRYGVGGTILATKLTDTYKYVFNIGGGLHHSFADRAEGFCYLNDVAIAAKQYLSTNKNKTVLIIDLDVHQGNGNAKIFENDPNVITFSIHQENIYPRKENSNFDIALPEFIKDPEYLELLKNSLNEISLTVKPDLIYYLAGADPYEDDLLGSIKLSFKGLRERDEIIKNFANNNNSPVVILTAGGYAKDFIDTVKIHCETARVFAKS